MNRYITLEQRKFNLITAVQLAETTRTDQIDGNARVLIHSCALDYQAAGGKKYTLGHDGVGDPFLIVAHPDEEY